ncbi:MAG: metallophosphoesterase [Daejeonella sp.]|nr:metallophosphoesterase [Daejeonella sp.]
MLFLTLSDTHGKHRLLKNLPKADVIIHVGDVSRDGSERSVLDFMNWFSELDYEYKIFIAGNHDFYFEQESESYLNKTIPTNLIYLNDSGVTINGINIWGSPITPWFYDWAFNRERGTEINKHWKLIPKNTDVLITHGPPMGILDQVNVSRSVGCEDLLKRINSIKPKVHVFGHIHEAYGSENIEHTKFINASILDENYQIKNDPILFQL